MNLAKLLGCGMAAVIAVAAAGGIYWLSLEPYWETRPSIYDAARNETLCIDENRETGPCIVLTVRGRRAIAERVKGCVERGGAADVCRREAWAWIDAQRPTR